MIKIFILLVFFSTSANGSPKAEYVQGKFGNFWRFRPPGAKQVLVLAHGKYQSKKEDPKQLAKTFLDRWTSLASTENISVLSFIFDNDNYLQEYGGYRGLFGRHVSADTFVMTEAMQELRAVGSTDTRFFLYGHSAGGQFANRFLVTHPNHLKGVILSAPGRYAYPNPDASWPYGMGKIEHTFHWPKVPPKKMSIIPDPKGWLAATMVPVHIVVGAKDLDPQPPRPGHRGGATRIDLAKNWQAEMSQVAAKHAKKAKITIEVIPGVGHDSKKLTPACQNAFISWLP